MLFCYLIKIRNLPNYSDFEKILSVHGNDNRLAAAVYLG